MNGRKLKEMRHKKMHTQQSLADAVGVSRAYIDAIENNRKVPSLPLLGRLAKELNCSIKSFF